MDKDFLTCVGTLWRDKGDAQQPKSHNPWTKELDEGNTKVANAGLQAQRRSRQALGEEVPGRGHEAREDAAANAADKRQREQGPVWGACVLDGKEPSHHGDDEQQRRHGHEFAGTHDGRKERENQAEESASKSRNCCQPVQLALRQRETYVVKQGGDILTIISAVFFAGQIATNGYFSKKVEPLKLVVMQMFVAGILFVVNVFIFSDMSKIQKPAGMMLIAIIYLTIFSTAIPTVLQTFCQKYTTSTRASILMSTESLFAPLFAFFILSERLSLRVAVGAGLVLFAVLVSETKLGLKKTPQ
mgnify:CR=1 FL=1